MDRAISIRDDKNQPIGELLTASDTDILKYLAKGLKVIDKQTGELITESMITGELGVSDGEMIMG